MTNRLGADIALKSMDVIAILLKGLNVLILFNVTHRIIKAREAGLSNIIRVTI